MNKKQQAYYNLFITRIESGQYILPEMLYKIEKRTIEGIFDEETRDNLIELAKKNVDLTYQEEMTAEERIDAVDNRCDDLEAMFFELCEIVSELTEGGLQ